MNITNPNYKPPQNRNIVTSCCNAPIVTGAIHDPHPLGSDEYNGNGITYKVNRCENCGNDEFAAIDVCEGCGLRECEGCGV
jgi:hypothetical protein